MLSDEYFALLQGAILQAPVGWCLLDEDLSARDANPLLRQWGGAPGKLEGRAVRDALPGELGERVHRLAERVRTTGEPQDECFAAGSGERRAHWQARVYPVAAPRASGNGLAQGVGVMLEDVTEREETLARLRHDQQTWQTVFGSDRVGVCLRTADGVLVSCNEAYAAIFEASGADALVGTDLHAILAPEDAEESMRGFRGHWADAPLEVQADRDHVLRSGRRISVHVTLALVRDQSGRPLHQLALVEDRTAHRRMEAELARTQRTEGLGRLAGGVAHDVNNMLSVILGYTEMVAEGLGAGHEMQGDLAEIRRAAEHSIELARDLLAVGRQQVLERQRLVPRDVVKGLAKLLRRTLPESVQMSIVDDSAGAAVVGDRAQLERVIVNLAANARDAMPDGGRLMIRTGRTMAADGAVERVTISVSDTGTGMTEEVLETIFDPFFTTKERGQGSGLGLATVSGVVEQMGGELSVTSAPGEGSTFVVSLSHDPGEVADAVAGTGDRVLARPPSRPRVLVVEDEEQVRGLVERMLDHLGYRTLSAGTAAAGLAILRDQSSDVDLLLTDVVLPDFGGGELARRARALRPGLCVVLTSGYPGEDAVHEDMAAANGFLGKPYGMEDLRRVLDAALRPAS